MSSAALKRVKAFLDTARPNSLLVSFDDLREVVAAAERCAELERRIADVSMFSAGLRLRNIEAQIVGEQLDEVLALSPKRATSGAAKRGKTRLPKIVPCGGCGAPLAYCECGQ